MMDEFDRLAMRFLMILVAGLLLTAYLLAIGWWLEPPPERIKIREFSLEEKRWIEKRQRIHGISASIFDGREHYFYRDGKRCRL
jgi:hypothetical protein